ncbi:hypothetical protein [Sulfuracidifex metallicus]|uniref:hypothetical protein n=1 Tax=Sulfuracidifex metallicus TaxID=47303 RepID=UPI0022752B48|nr:hypothetical protein [Sulfuracidifex metallicus]MCY0849537.1 hypothetical protein [Sulfuracidifex metallicus]
MYFVNSTDIPFKIIITQTNDERDLLSNTTYNLIATSLFNKQPIIPSGLKPFSAIENNSNIRKPEYIINSIDNYIILFNLIMIPFNPNIIHLDVKHLPFPTNFTDSICVTSEILKLESDYPYLSFYEASNNSSLNLHVKPGLYR